MKFVDDKLVDAQSHAVTVTSETVLIDQIYGYAVQAYFTGSPSGVMHLEGSCDNAQQIANVTAWTTIDESSTTVSSSGASVFYNATAQNYKYFRVVYTPYSGTGLVTVFYNGKG